jgi:transketolase
VRTAFIHALAELATEDPKVTLVVSDLGFGVVLDFAKRFPRQFLNAGVAEQNMTGLAAGLALCGRTVFTYSIANFPTLRCIEQVRNDVCYHRANVKVVSVGGGLAYGSLGSSHHATEDIGVMRLLPEMTVVAPGDPIETAAAVRALAHTRGPAYLRLGRAGEPVVHHGPVQFRLGRALTVRPGDDVTLISTGGMLHTAVQAAEMLDSHGVRARVLSMHTVHPLDETAVLAAARETAAVVTLEEHSIRGGLGGAVAELLAEAAPAARLTRLGLPHVFTKEVGDQQHLLKHHGLDSASVCAAVLRALDRVSTLQPAE